MRILIVDDWPDTATSWVTLLRLLGFEADAATSGRQALEIARTRRPDKAILDMNMPGMNGCELARQLRLLYPDHLVLIAITARDSQQDRDRLYDAGFDHYLAKPADPLKVISLLRTLSLPIRDPH